MKRKAITVYALLSIIIIAAAGTELVKLVEANPYSMFLWSFNISPITDPPVISLMSPTNGTIQQNATSIIFNVIMPQSWTYQVPSGSAYGEKVFVGQIKSVNFSLDQNLILSNNTLFGLVGFFIQDYSDPNYLVRNINYTQNVESLSSGQHNLTISVEAYTLYNYPQNSWCNVSVNETYLFMVGTPVITNLSLEGRTYGRSSVPLVFNVNESTSWIGCSLDNRANETLAGNVTLTDLAEGTHSIVVYANDTFGNMGKSDTVFFDIALPTPSPSASPTLKPTMEVTPGPKGPRGEPGSQAFDFTLMLVAVIAVAVIVYFAIVYKQRRRKL